MTLARLLGVFAFGIAGLQAGGALPDQAATPQRLEAVEDAMGSSFMLVLHGPDRAARDAAADAAFAEVHRLDRLLSNYKPASEWSRVNRQAAEGAVHVSDELFSLLSACLEYSRRSGGAFDITVGPLMKVWGFYRDEGRLPREADVKASLAHVGYRHVILDGTKRTVRFARDGIELDPGGIGKGYAVDRMVEVLRRAGVASALVSAAGSSVYGLGAPPDDPRGWPIEIRDPRDAGAAASRVFLKNSSISTSGSYEKFFRAGDRTYSHILDPRTGSPATGTSSVSVLAPRALDSEAWTKPFFINGREWGERHRPRELRVFICDDRPPPSCRWLQ